MKPHEINALIKRNPQVATLDRRLNALKIQRKKVETTLATRKDTAATATHGLLMWDRSYYEEKRIDSATYYTQVNKSKATLKTTHAEIRALTSLLNRTNKLIAKAKRQYSIAHTTAFIDLKHDGVI